MDIATNGISWDGAVGNAAIAAFLKAKFPNAEDGMQQPSFGIGFTSMRRSQCISICDEFDLEYPRADLPAAHYQNLIQTAWDNGKMGDVSKYARQTQGGDVRLTALEMSVETLAGDVGKILKALEIEPEREPDGPEEGPTPKAGGKKKD